MKILQRNLSRSTFVVWEIKRNVSVVCVSSRCNILISGKIMMRGTCSMHTHGHKRFRRFESNKPIDSHSCWRESTAQWMSEGATVWLTGKWASFCEHGDEPVLHSRYFYSFSQLLYDVPAYVGDLCNEEVAFREAIGVACSTKFG